jgi:hypothetical protein
MIAGLAAFGVSVLVSWVVSRLGLPWVAPVRSDGLTLFPVRLVAAMLWASGAFAARRLVKP